MSEERHRCLNVVRAVLYPRICQTFSSTFGTTKPALPTSTPSDSRLASSAAIVNNTKAMLGRLTPSPSPNRLPLPQLQAGHEPHSRDDHVPEQATALHLVLAAFLVTSLTPGMSAVQFKKMLGIERYETAFQMLHKLRAAMVRPKRDSIGQKFPVEVDETFVGGATQGKGRGMTDKVLVVGAVEVMPRRESGKWGGRDPKLMGGTTTHAPRWARTRHSRRQTPATSRSEPEAGNADTLRAGNRGAMCRSTDGRVDRVPTAGRSRLQP